MSNKDFTIMHRYTKNGKKTDKDLLAETIARMLLMPETSFKQYYNLLKSRPKCGKTNIEILADIFIVSEEEVIKRIEELGLTKNDTNLEL